MYRIEEAQPQQAGEAPLVVVDRAEMYAIIADAMDEKMTEVDALWPRIASEKLKPVRQTLGPNQEVTKAGSLRYRVREIGPMVVSGIINQTTPRGLRDMILASFASLLNGVASVQTRGDWQAIAWEGRQGFKLRRVRVPAQQAEWSQLQEDPTRYGGGKPSPQRTKPAYAKDPCLTIYVVFVDVSNTDEQDPWYDRTGKTDGSMQSWTTQGILPPALMEERKSALDLLSRWMRKNEEQVAAPVNVLTESRLDGAARLLMSGANLPMVAEAIGVSPAALKEALVTHGHFTPDNFPAFVPTPPSGEAVPQVEPETAVDLRNDGEALDPPKRQRAKK